MNVCRRSLLLAIAIVIPTEVDANTCPAPTPSEGLPARCTAPTIRAGYCTGNTDKSADIQCNEKRMLIKDATTTKKATEADCCEEKKGYCKGNKDANSDHQCGAGTEYVTDAEIVKGNTDELCCGQKCSAVRNCAKEKGLSDDDSQLNFVPRQDEVELMGRDFICCHITKCCDAGAGNTDVDCGADAQLKPNAKTTGRGPTADNKDNCCVDIVKGKCEGNTDSSSDVKCGTNKKNLGNGVVGDTEAKCCKDTCATITCDGDKVNKGQDVMNPLDKTNCCADKIKDKCDGNTDASTNVECEAGTKFHAVPSNIDVAGLSAAAKQTKCCKVATMCSGNKQSSDDVDCGKCANSCSLKSNAAKLSWTFKDDDHKCRECCDPNPATAANAHGAAVLSSVALATVFSAICLF